MLKALKCESAKRKRRPILEPALSRFDVLTLEISSSASADDFGHLEDRQEHTDDHAADDEAEEND
jgi:hypothetical protein